MLVYYAHVHTWSRGPSCTFRFDHPSKGKDGSQPQHSIHSRCLSNVETCSVVQPCCLGTCLQESTWHLPKKLQGSHRRSMMVYVQSALRTFEMLLAFRQVQHSSSRSLFLAGNCGAHRCVCQPAHRSGRPE